MRLFLFELTKNIINVILLSIPFYFVFDYFTPEVLDMKAVVVIGVVYLYIQHTKKEIKDLEEKNEPIVKKCLLNALSATICMYVLLIINILFRGITIKYVELSVGFFLTFIYYLLIFAIFYFYKRDKYRKKE